MEIINTLAIVVLAIIAVLSLLFIGWEARYWKSPMENKEKISRSVGTGIGTTIGVISVLSVLDLSSAPKAIANWTFVSYLGVFCMGVPLGVVASIGTFIGFTVLDTLRGRK